jgi:hypothetical protein
MNQCALRSCVKNPVVVSGGVTLSYLLFYTAYDKATKSMNPKNLIDLVTLRRGLDWTLVELNKAVSLAGMTTMLLAFTPQMKEKSKELLFISMNMLWGHSIYSMYKFYQFDPRNIIKDKWMKQLSVGLGSAGQLALAAGYWGYISNANLILSATVLGIAHFWTMEVDFKYVLQVRPFAYLPFPMAAYNLYNYVLERLGRA